MTIMRTRLALLPLMAAVLLASGCSNKDKELQQWLTEVKARKPARLEPIPQVKPYEPFTYVVADRRNPFLLADADRPEQRVSTGDGGLRPDLNRNREALEAFPLDALSMLGIIRIGTATYALVLAPDGIVHRAALGNYLGQNYGRITAIDETEVALAELVPDGFGGWVQRPASLALEE